MVDRCLEQEHNNKTGYNTYGMHIFKCYWCVGNTLCTLCFNVYVRM